MKISVITVAYKNSKVVVDLLNSIAKYNDIGDELEVIIVDNSPEDARIEEAIKVSNYKDYIYIKADNKGFGAGNNRGAEIAKGEIFAFLNPDIILIEPIFKKICNKFAEDEKLAWLGGQLLSKDGKKNLSFGYCPEYTPLTFYEILKFKLVGYGVFDSQKMYLIGANIIVKHSVFENVGLFDENIFMYAEEADLMKRILENKDEYKVQFCSDIKMVHLEGHSLNWLSFERMKIQMQSLKYYFERHVANYGNVVKKMYAFEKKKLVIDKIFRPIKAERRKKYIRLLEEQFPEFIN